MGQFSTQILKESQKISSTRDLDFAFNAEKYKEMIINFTKIFKLNLFILFEKLRELINLILYFYYFSGDKNIIKL